MKENSGVKTSFLNHMVISFIFMIVIPVLVSWWIYENVLKYYYLENTLKAQQNNLEKSISLLDSSLDAVSNMFVALEGNSDLTYYLDYNSGKSNMLFRNFENVKKFCEEMYMMNSYLERVRIYCDSPLVIYADPFVKTEHMMIEEEVQKELEQVGFQETVWCAVNSDTETFPQIYGYRKLYSNDYFRCIGYMEVSLSSQLIADYIETVTGFCEESDTFIELYRGNERIYTTAVRECESIFVEDMASEYEILFLKNEYRNYLKIPEVDLCVVCRGTLKSQNVILEGHIPSILISVIIVLLLILFFAFFGSIVSLSKRILAFASFIRESDSNHLLRFVPRDSTSRKEDEINVLIDTYNELIQEKNSLISQIEKMELFSRDARYQVLQGQIHPHFIYGTLETIRMTALQNKDREAASMIFSLASLIRYSISGSSKTVTLKDEVAVARHYLQIQKIRFDDRLNYVFRIEEKLLEMELPSLIFQPVLENAIIYGVTPTMDPCIVEVEAYEKENQIILSVSNTGIPITEERLQEVNGLLSGRIPLTAFRGNRNGLALNNISERIGIFFRGSAAIQLAARDGYTITVITIEKNDDMSQKG